MSILTAAAGYLTQSGTVSSRGLTVTCWAKWTSMNTDYRAIMALGSADPTRILYLTIDMGRGAIETDMYVSGDHLLGFCPIAGQWYFLALVVDASGNGQLFAGYANTLGYLRSGPIISIGSYTETLAFLGDPGGGFLPNASICDIKTWTTALTTNELLAEMPFLTGPQKAGARSWNKLATTADLSDYTGNGHAITVNGTCSNGATPAPVSYSRPNITTIKKIHCEGDSRTFGTNSTSPYPAQLGTLRPADTVVNYGIPGNTSIGVYADIITNVIPALSGVNTNAIVVWAGINDYQNGSGQVDTIGGIESCADLIITNGAIAVICSEIGCNPVVVSAANMAAIGTAVGAAGAGPWVFCDLSAHPELMDYNNTVYSDFSGDQLHPNAAGDTIIANAVSLAIDTLDAPTIVTPVIPVQNIMIPIMRGLNM